MAYRPPFGYNPGLQQGQQQQPIPGQMMQTPQQYPGAGMMPQGYQMPQQGAMVMAPGMYYPNQQMMMQQGFVPAGMMGRGQMPHQQVQQMVHPQQQQQQQPQTEEDKRREEKLKKDRYFQEQKMKLQQFGKGAKPNLSLDMASSLVESLGGPKRPQAQGAKQTQPKPVETDSFGDFQKAGGNLQPVESEETEDDFGDFLQARPAAGSTSAHPERTDSSGGISAVSQQGPAEAPAPAAPEATSDNPVPEKKPEISLEDMMMMSTDLSEATKSAKPIHVKKTLKDVKAHQPATKSATFLASNRSRTWSSDDNFSSLFTVDTPAAALNVGQVPTAEGVGGVQQQQQQLQMSIPEWCANPSALPLVYQQVYEATFRNGAIQTELLYPILLMSGLDRQALGIIWNMVNKTQPGVLVRQELIYALALIALHQNKMPVTLESLFSLAEAPLPTLTPQQSGPTASAPIPSAPHQPTVSGPNGSSLPSEQAQGTTSLQSDSSEPLSSFSQSVAREKEVFNAHFDREEENCYIFTTSPTASSSGHSSPVLWDQNSIYDKLRSRSRESLSSSSINSEWIVVGDHTVEDPIHLSEFKTHQPDAPPSNSLEEEFAEFQSSRDMQAFQKSPPFVSIPAPVAVSSFSSTPSSHGPTKSATSPNLHALSESSSDVDLEFGDFSSHRATQHSSTTEAPFGDFQNSTATGGSIDQWATFQHASSEPSLMSNANEDKYAAFKVLEQTSDRDLFGGTVAPVETQVESEDEGGSALRGMVSESDDEEPFSNFQVASIPAEFLNQSAPQGLNIPSIPSNMFSSPMNDVTNQEDFGDFVGPKDQKEESMKSGNIVFGDSSLLSSSSSNLPTTLSFPSSANLGVDSFTSYESTLSTGGGDRYEAFKDLQLNGEDKNVEVEDDDFGDFHAVEPSLSSKDAFSLDLENNVNSGISESVGGSFMMSTDLTSDNSFNQSTPKEPSKPPPIHPGLEGPPLLLASESIIGGDRYSEVAGDKVDENRHVTAWERCLKSCHSAIKVANDVLNNISSSSVCKQVTSSSSGSSYFKAIVEVYRVACRVFASIQARGVETDILVKLNDDIEKTWTNLSAFLSSTPLQIDNSSFVFKTATLKPEPENQDKACGVCLLNVDARSKAYNRSEDSLKLSYGGRQYHATCANLWVNMVDSILPALPLEALL